MPSTYIMIWGYDFKISFFNNPLDYRWIPATLTKQSANNVCAFLFFFFLLHFPFRLTLSNLKRYQIGITIALHSLPVATQIVGGGWSAGSLYYCDWSYKRPFSTDFPGYPRPLMVFHKQTRRAKRNLLSKISNST